MRFFPVPRVWFLLLLVLFFAVPNAYSSVSFMSPPVEKKKPLKKKRFIRKGRMKIRKNKATNSGKWAIPLLIIFFVLLIAGGFLFGFGIFLFPLWILGLCLMGVAAIGTFLLLLYVFYGKNSIDKMAFGFGGLLFAWLTLLGHIFFLIYGVVMGLPFVWIIGIVFIVVALLYFLFLMLVRQHFLQSF